MVTAKSRTPQKLDLSHLPIPQGDQSGSKWLIAAVLAAGQDGCQCSSCQLLKKFGAELSTALLKEETDGAVHDH